MIHDLKYNICHSKHNQLYNIPNYDKIYGYTKIIVRIIVRYKLA